MPRLLADPFVLTAIIVALGAVSGGVAILWRAAADAATEAGSASIAAHPAVVAVVSEPSPSHRHDVSLTIGILKIVDGGEVAIEEVPLLIGRHSTNDVRLDDVRVSRHHARIDRNTDGALEIHNLTASRSEPNPMSINGDYRETAVLHDGDQISLGGVEFVFHAAKPEPTKG